MRDCFNIDNITNYNDDALRNLKDKIEKEIEQRDKQRETEAKKKVVKAIQDFLAAGFTLYVKGEIETEDECYGSAYRTIEGVIEEVRLENNEVILDFCESY
jgi:50S ribosomal subunit-associated GTPase HflX